MPLSVAHRYFAAADAAGGVDFDTFTGVAVRNDQGAALAGALSGGSGQTDRMAAEILPFWLPFLPADHVKYDEARELLADFDGSAWPASIPLASAISDGYILANAWLFEVMVQLFEPLFPPGTPRFSIPGLGGEYF